MNLFVQATASLAIREIQRFFRQPSRVLAALGTPLLFWLVLGSGLGTSFRPSEGPVDQHFLKYFFPGVVMLTVMFTAIFSTISIIEDRSAGFLQGVLVSPAPRSSVVLGKVLGGTVLALIQGGLFLFLAPLAGFGLSLSSFLLSLGFLLLTAFALTSLGFLIAWRMDSIQGFHAMMNLLLMPLWMLSGAVFPASGALGWIRILIAANPLSYGVSGLRAVLEGGSPQGPSPALCGAVLALASLLLFGASSLAAHKKEK